MVQFSPQV